VRFNNITVHLVSRRWPCGPTEGVALLKRRAVVAIGLGSSGGSRGGVPRRQRGVCGPGLKEAIEPLRLHPIEQKMFPVDPRLWLRSDLRQSETHVFAKCCDLWCAFYSGARLAGTQNGWAECG
jgi:hypothetical protein